MPIQQGIWQYKDAEAVKMLTKLGEKRKRNVAIPQDLGKYTTTILKYGVVAKHSQLKEREDN